MTVRKGQVEILIAATLFALVLIPFMFISGTGPGLEARDQVDDITPFKKTTFLATNMKELYIEPVKNYSIYRASFEALNTTYYPRTRNVYSEEAFYSQLEDAAQQEINERLSVDISGRCSSNDPSVGVEVEDGVDSEEGTPGMEVSFVADTPLHVACEGDTSSFERWIPVSSSVFSPVNRFGHLVNITRAIMLDDEFVQLAESWDLPPYLRQTEFEQLEERFEQDYRSSDFRGFDIEMTNTTPERRGVIGINVTDTRYTVPTRSGYRPLSMNVTYIFIQDVEVADADVDDSTLGG